MDGGIMEVGALASLAGSGLSLASMGMKAGGDVAAGYAKAQEAQVRGTNALLQANSQATNFRLRGASEAANDRYKGAQEAEQFGLESQRDLVQASQADTAAQFGKLQADMTDASARDSLRNILGNIAVTRAAGGADLTSPTTAALQGHVTNIAELNREAAVTSINAQTAEEQASAKYLHEASAFALTQGGKAQAMGEYNATNAENFADYNAKTALQYGLYNASAASATGSSAVGFGYANASADILGGLGKAFSSGTFGLGGGTPANDVGPFNPQTGTFGHV